MRRRVPDIHKIVALTGRRPTVQLDEILERTRDWLAGNERHAFVNVMARSL